MSSSQSEVKVRRTGGKVDLKVSEKTGIPSSWRMFASECMCMYVWNFSCYARGACKSEGVERWNVCKRAGMVCVAVEGESAWRKAGAAR